MLLALLALGMLFLVLLRWDGLPRRMASIDDMTSARLIAATRLQRIEEERRERFQAYDRAWSIRGGRREFGRGYVVEFRAGGRRG
jgi:hypothetical protein